MSLFGRKEKRRIAQLEEKLHDAIHNQVTVHIASPEPIRVTLVGLPKGQWYNVSYRFRVGDDLSVTTGDHVVTNDDPQPYFDGYSYEWTGKDGREHTDGGLSGG